MVFDVNIIILFIKPLRSVNYLEEFPLEVFVHIYNMDTRVDQKGILTPSNIQASFSSSFFAFFSSASMFALMSVISEKTELQPSSSLSLQAKEQARLKPFNFCFMSANQRKYKK